MFILEVIDVLSCFGDCSLFMYHAVVISHFWSVSVSAIVCDPVHCVLP